MPQSIDGFTTLVKDRSIISLVTIPRVRPHAYLKLTKAESYIFVLFHVINDIMIMITKKLPINIENAAFTSDVLTKLNNIGMGITDLTGNVTEINMREYLCAMFRVMLALGVMDSNPLLWDQNLGKHFCNYAIIAREQNAPALSIIIKNTKLKLLDDELKPEMTLDTGHRGFYASVKRLIEEEKVQRGTKRGPTNRDLDRAGK